MENIGYNWNCALPAELFRLIFLKRFSVLSLSFHQTFFVHTQVYADTLVHMDSARTLQGSPLSFSCGGMDNIVSADTLKKNNKKNKS